MLDPVVSILIALSAALLFGVAAVLKLRSPREFAATLAEYRILPATTSLSASLLLGTLEFAVAAGLLWPATRSTGAAIGATLLSLYAAAIGINLARGRRDLDCGCGIQPRTIGGWMVVRNLLFAAVLGVLQLPVLLRPLGFPDFASIGGGLTVAVLLYVSADLLLGRSAPRPLFSTERS